MLLLVIVVQGLMILVEVVVILLHIVLILLHIMSIVLGWMGLVFVPAMSISPCVGSPREPSQPQYCNSTMVRCFVIFSLLGIETLMADERKSFQPYG